MNKRNLTIALLAASVAAYADGFSIRFSQNGGPSRLGFEDGALRVQNIPMRGVLSMAYGLPETRIEGPSWLDDAVDIEMPVEGRMSNAAVAKLRSQLEESLHIESREDKREMEVWVLKSGSAVKLKPSTDQPRMMMTPASLEATSQPMRSILRQLEREARKPLLDETGLTERYNVTLSLEPGDPASVKAGLESLGLLVEPARRTVPVLVIGKIDKPAAR